MTQKYRAGQPPIHEVTITTGDPYRARVLLWMAERLSEYPPEDEVADRVTRKEGVSPDSFWSLLIQQRLNMARHNGLKTYRGRYHVGSLLVNVFQLCESMARTCGPLPDATSTSDRITKNNVVIRD